MMVGTDLADTMRSAMGYPAPTSTQFIGWGTGIVEHIQTAAIVTNASGTITGTVPPAGGALGAGAGADGMISGLDGSALANLVITYAGYPFVSTILQAYCDEIVSHIQTFGIVTFAPGTITGTCTNTTMSPGTLAGGAGSGGLISGLDGTVLANAIHAAAGYPDSTSVKLIEFCTSMVNYIMGNAEASYASGNVTGTCPAGGGSLGAGAGANGTVA